MLTTGPLRPVTSTQLPTSPSITVLLYDAARFHCAHARYAGSRVSKTLHALRAGLGSGDTEGSRQPDRRRPLEAAGGEKQRELPGAPGRWM